MIQRGRPKGSKTGASQKHRARVRQQIGERIRELRKQIDLSQEQLGDRMKVSTQQVSVWELGKTLPDVCAIMLLSVALNCKPGWLAFGDGR